MAILSETDLDFLCKFVRERSGISLDESKAYLFESRLDPLVRRHPFESIPELVERLRKLPADPKLEHEVVDALTTNETSFFRDFKPFEALKSYVIPKLLERRNSEKKINIWCGASSSGQEPYTIAMLLRETFPQLQSWNVTFVATDISETMLTRCREGIYSQLEINRGLPTPLLVKYFSEVGRNWQISEDIRKMVEFKKLNLVKPWPPMPRMDVVLMRNVLIYFELEVRQAIVRQIKDLLRPDGYLFLGSTESALLLDPAYKPLDVKGSSCYSLNGQ